MNDFRGVPVHKHGLAADKTPELDLDRVAPRQSAGCPGSGMRLRIRVVVRGELNFAREHRDSIQQRLNETKPTVEPLLGAKL